LIFDFVFYERQISGDVIRNSDIRKRLTKKIDLNIPNANTDKLIGSSWFLLSCLPPACPAYRQAGGRQGRQACTVTLRCAQGFMFIAYNLRRIISILGKDRLMKHLGILVSLIFAAIVCSRRKLSHLEAMWYYKR
jgi:hypothetical protein